MHWMERCPGWIATELPAPGCIAMSVETIVSRLDGVRESGSGRYLARCPAHEDKSPSLSIREKDDGRVLLHCFAGCETESVLDAIGLTMSDLYSEPLGHHFKPSAQRVNPREILASLDHESLVVVLIGADFISRRSLDEATWTRLAMAVNRINTARAQAAPLRLREVQKNKSNLVAA